MIRLGHILSALWFCALVPHVLAEGPGIPEFYLHYALLENMGFRESKSDELLKLQEIAPGKAQWLTEFWRTRAQMACQPYVDHLAQMFASRLTKSPSEKREEIEKQLREKMAYVMCSYYYDHWTDINEMIVLNLERALREQGEDARVKASPDKKPAEGN
jgi:hypothetical protein